MTTPSDKKTNDLSVSVAAAGQVVIDGNKVTFTPEERTGPFLELNAPTRLQRINRITMLAALGFWLLAMLLTAAVYFLGDETLVELTRQNNAMTKAVAALVAAGAVCGTVSNFTNRRPAWLIAAVGMLVCWILIAVLFTGLPGMTIETILTRPLGGVLAAGILLGFMASFAPDIVTWRRALRRPA